MEGKKEGMPQHNEKWKPEREIIVDTSSGTYLSFQPDGTIRSVAEGKHFSNREIKTADALKDLQRLDEKWAQSRIERATRRVEQAENELRYAQQELERTRQMVQDVPRLIEFLSKPE